MIRPRPLMKGDKVAVICLSRGILGDIGCVQPWVAGLPLPQAEAEKCACIHFKDTAGSFIPVYSPIEFYFYIIS